MSFRSSEKGCSPPFPWRLTSWARKSTLKGLSAYVKEHFPNAAYGVYSIENDSKLAIIIVANKYSPNNFWYGCSFLAPTSDEGH